MIKVLLADDNAAFLASLCLLLKSTRDLEVVGAAGSGPDAIRLSLECIPDVALLDVRMPGCSGLEATRSILLSQPRVRVILLSISTEPAYVAEAARVGAVGYLSKTASLEQIVVAIRKAASGGSCFAPPPLTDTP